MPEKHSHWKLIFGIVLGIIILIIAGIFFFTRNGNYKTVVVEKKDLVLQVDVTGEVIPADEVDLSFVVGGKVSGISVREGGTVNKGDVIARLDSSEIEASIRQAAADKDLRNAELDALIGGQGGAGQYDSVKAEAVSLIEKAFSVADNQIKINVDSLYENPQSARPEVTFAINKYLVRQKLNQERTSVGKLLDNWNSFVSSVNTNSVSESDLNSTLDNLSAVRTFVENLSDALSSAEASGSVTDAKLSEFRTNVTTARTSVDSMIDQIVTVREKLRSTASDVPIKQAQISSSQAAVEKYEAQIGDYEIRAPFDGIVAEVLVTNGEIVSPNQVIISLISKDDLELEVFIPEVQISHLNAGDSSKVTFDAINMSPLPATVVYVGARATKRDGISTYKTTLDFDEFSELVRSGMTANISIETLRIKDLIIIPLSAVKNFEDVSIVNVIDNGSVTTKTVQLGQIDSYGGVEVMAGLNVGEELIIGKN